MNTAQLLRSAWSWPLAMVPGTALLLAASWANWRAGRKTGTRSLWRWGCWAAGVAVFLSSLVSPIGVLAEHYLFSAHMLQHLLLLLVVPALCLLGWPTAEAARPAPRFRRVGHPVLAWAAGVGAMWLWHAPPLCNAATADPRVRALQTVSLLVLGTWFWWPIIGPQADRRLAPLAGVVYLFTACLACTLLGIFITFTPLRMCSIYDHPVDPLGALPLLRQQWGLTPAVDQQLGGLIMWVPACLIYLTGILSLLLRWFAGHETTRTNPLASQHA